MSTKIIIVLFLAGLLLLGSVLAQTNAVNQNTNSNTAANVNRPSNVIKTNPNPIQRIMSPELQTQPVDEVKSAACQYLTENDAANIFGKPMIYYTSTTYEKELKCIYMPPKEFPMGITFEIKTFATVKQAVAYNRMMFKIAQSINLQHPLPEGSKEHLPEPEDITGIADSAFFATSGDNYEYINFQKGKTVFEIRVLGKTGSHFDENVLKSCAKKIALSFNQ